MSPVSARPRTIITGGTRGIGAAAARRLAAIHDVVALGRAGAHEPPAPGIRVDVAEATDAAAVEAAFARADADGAGLTGLVVSAGVWEPSTMDGGAAEVATSFRRILDVNVIGAVHAVAAFLPRMRRGAHASIVLVGSTAGQRGEAGHAGYAASKAALMGLAKSWAVELAPRGARVNVVAPGWVDTEMSQSALGDPKRRAAIEATIPRGRVATPEDLAGPIAFLLSDDSLHVTGTILSVNGGGVLASF